jgi:Ribulose-5-phosphate 4-epimerase and related epimerases and aldolases
VKVITITDLLNLPLVQEYCRAASDIYRHNWAERNGGNISMILESDFTGLEPVRTYPLGFDTGLMNGRYLLVTGSGVYLKNVERDPEASLALLRIGAGSADLLWGLKDGGRPSSELAAHLQSHAARLAADPKHRVVTHTHATHMVALSRVHRLDDRALTKTLWSMCTECLLFFPDGVGVLPWMPCGTDGIGAATAEKMRDCRIVLWANHGVFAAGSSPDDALGLLEVADKAAELYIMTSHLPALSVISDAQLRRLAAATGVAPREGWL